MKKFEKKKNKNTKLIVQIAMFVIIIAIFFVGIQSTARTNDAEAQTVLESAVKKAVIQCYALEGMYPPNIEYLENNYGLIVDKKKFAVHYEAFASNVMPSIDIVPLYTN